MIARELVAIPSYAVEVEEGLAKSQKTLPTKLFYDAVGSELFDEITRLPEYYLSRTESKILRDFDDEIAQAAGPNVAVVELGAGAATKTSTLLLALARKQIRTPYFPVDISPSALAKAKIEVKRNSPAAFVHPVVADFSQGFGFLQDIPGRKLVLYLGSSIGNFNPEVAVAMLAGVRQELSAGDALLLGTDMVKDPAIMVPAYDDAQGVTAQFNKNILGRLNRELGAGFNLDTFRHVAIWNSLRSRMEMHLESMVRQTVDIELLESRIKFASGERIHTEDSHKYTMKMVNKMLKAASFSLDQTWFDDKKWFSLHLARV